MGIPDFQKSDKWEYLIFKSRINGNTPLLKTEWAVFQHVFHLICRTNISYVSPFFQTALAYACFSGCLPIVEILSEVPGVDVNLADKEGNTPMIFASQAGNIVFKSKFLMATNLKIRENRMRQSRMDNMCYSESSSAIETWLWVAWRVSYKKQELLTPWKDLVSPHVLLGGSVLLLLLCFLCFVLCFVFALCPCLSLFILDFL